MHIPPQAAVMRFGLPAASYVPTTQTGEGRAYVPIPRDFFMAQTWFREDNCFCRSGIGRNPIITNEMKKESRGVLLLDDLDVCPGDGRDAAVGKLDGQYADHALGFHGL